MAVNPMLVGGIGVGVTAVAVTGGLYAGGVIGGSEKTNTGQRGTGSNPEIPWRSLFGDKEYSENGTTVKTEYTGKWGATYSKYLLGAGTARTGVTPADNTHWWNEKLKELNEDQTKSDKFKSINKAKGDDASSLSKVCDTIYRLEAAKVTTQGTEDGAYKESEVWKFCSLAGEKIESINDKGDSTEYQANSPWGHEDKHKKELVSVTSNSKGNEWFWKERDKKLTGDERKKFITDQIKSVKEWCADAYKKTTAPDPAGQYTQANVFKWCSLSEATPQ